MSQTKQKRLGQRGLSRPAVLVVGLVVVIVGAWAFRVFWRTHHAYEATQVPVLDVQSAELGGIQTRRTATAWTDEGVAIDVLLQGSGCPKGEIFATVTPAGNRQAYLSFICDPTAKKENADERAVRQVRFVWSPQPSSSSLTGAPVKEVQDLWVGPIQQDRGSVYQVQVTLNAEFIDGGKGLRTPLVKYASPSLQRSQRNGEAPAAAPTPEAESKPSTKSAI